MKNSVFEVVESDVAVDSTQVLEATLCEQRQYVVKFVYKDLNGNLEQEIVTYFKDEKKAHDFYSSTTASHAGALTAPPEELNKKHKKKRKTRRKGTAIN